MPGGAARARRAPAHATACPHPHRLSPLLALRSTSRLLRARWPNGTHSQFALDTAATRALIAQTNSYYVDLVAKATKIIWVNGDVDPWHRQSNYQEPPGKEQTVLPIVKGAHHCAWMSPATAGEQASLVQARKEIWAQLDAWLSPSSAPRM